MIEIIKHSIVDILLVMLGIVGFIYALYIIINMIKICFSKETSSESLKPKHYLFDLKNIETRYSDFFRKQFCMYGNHFFPNLRVGDKVFVKNGVMKKPKIVKIVGYGKNGSLHNCLFYKFLGKTYYLCNDTFIKQYVNDKSENEHFKKNL
jgi:hypothetical protein